MTNMEIAALASEQIPFRESMAAAEYDARLELIREVIIPYGDRKPKRSHDYNNVLLCEVLRNIRRGETDYVFGESQLIELLRYEPRAQIVYMSDCGVWEVSIAAEESLAEDCERKIA